MKNRRAFRPDLTDSVLEDRTLAAYDSGLPPLVLTAGGYAAFAVPPGLSANLGTLGGASIGGSGGSVGTTFFVIGFGTAGITVGNPIGFSFGGASKIGATGVLNNVVGSGANDAQGPQPVSRNAVAQGDANATALKLLYIGPQTSSGGYVPGAARWEGLPGSSGPLPPPAPPPVSPAPPPTPGPTSDS
ncbi:MAG: hypothetical protein P4L84_37845 [Isosphaeraceae bacterium]|nr:hypothetical protein [Isosphaeraceae bacterium]